jgi:hypothetical protein
MGWSNDPIIWEYTIISMKTKTMCVCVYIYIYITFKSSCLYWVNLYRSGHQDLIISNQDIKNKFLKIKNILF